jgi:hypothetical protein
MLFYDWTDFLKIKKIIDIAREEIDKEKIDRDNKKEIEMKKMRDRYYDKNGEEHIRVDGYENIYYKSGHKCKCKAEVNNMKDGLYDENVEKCIKVKEYEDIYYKSEETGISYESMKEEDDKDNEYIENVGAEIQINIDDACDKLIKIIFKSLKGEERKAAFIMIKENPYSNDISRYVYKRLSYVVYNLEDGFDRDEITKEVKKVIARSISNEQTK